MGVFHTLSAGNMGHPEMAGTAAPAVTGIVRATAIIASADSNIGNALEACRSFGIGLSCMGS